MSHDQSPTARASHKKAFPFLELPAELRNRVYDLAIEMTPQYAATVIHRPNSTSAPFSFRHPGRPFLGLAQTNKQLRAEFGPILPGPRLRFATLHDYLSTFPLADADLNTRIITACKDLADENVVTQDAGVDILPLLSAPWDTLPFRFVKDYSDGERNPTDLAHWLSLRLKVGTFKICDNHIQDASFLSNGTLESVSVVRKQDNVKIVTIIFNEDKFAGKEEWFVNHVKMAILAHFADMAGVGYPSTQFRCRVGGKIFAARMGKDSFGLYGVDIKELENVGEDGEDGEGRTVWGRYW